MNQLPEPTAKFEGVEILALGEWNAANGEKWTCTPDHLASIVEAAQDIETGIRPIKYGHTEADTEPAKGYLENVRYSPDRTRLLADLEDVDQSQVTKIKNHYKDRSSELVFNYQTNSGKVYPAVLKGLALLGAATAAVKGLAKLPDAIYLSEHNPHASIHILPANIPHTGQENSNTETTNHPEGENMDKIIRDLLGLPATATDQEVLAANTARLAAEGTTNAGNADHPTSADNTAGSTAAEAATAQAGAAAASGGNAARVAADAGAGSAAPAGVADAGTAATAAASSAAGGTAGDAAGDAAAAGGDAGAAVADAGTEGAGAAGAGGGTAGAGDQAAVASLIPGSVNLSEGRYAELLADAEEGKALRLKNAKADAQKFIDDTMKLALSEGRISPAKDEVAKYRALLEAAPEAGKAHIMSLRPTITTIAQGQAVNLSEGSGQVDAATRAANLRVYGGMA